MNILKQVLYISNEEEEVTFSLYNVNIWIFNSFFYFCFWGCIERSIIKLKRNFNILASMSLNIPVIQPEMISLIDQRCVSGEVLTSNQVSQWRNEGYLLVDGIFQESSIQSALNEIKILQMSKEGASEFEVGDGKTFPTMLESLDALTLCPDFLTAMQQLLGTDDIRMCQAETWKKVAVKCENGTDNTFSNQDQRMHMDFPNHTLVHPPQWDKPEAVAVIIYLSEDTECGGATRVVPRLPSPSVDDLYQWPYTNMPGYGEIPWSNDRPSTEEMLSERYPDVARFREQLYAREKSITYSPGTVLFYRHDLWHRGTPLIPGSERFVMNLVFKRTGCDWLNHWNRGTAYSMYSRTQYVEKLIAKLTPEQRSCLGFPRPGSAYWTPDTLEAVRRRYEVFGMDMTPYTLVASAAPVSVSK